MKITFACDERLYKWLCDTEEYLRSTEHLRERKYASLEEGVFCITPDKVYSTVEGRIALMSYRPISL